MLRIQFIGHIGKDAEVKVLADGAQVISFTVAQTQTWKSNGEKKEKTTWINCNLWRGKDASIAVADYLKKGTKVLVEGEPSAHAYLNNDKPFASLDCRVDNVELLSKVETASSATPAQTGGYAPPVDLSSKPGEDDDLPF